MSNKWYKKGSELLREIEETCLPKELCSPLVYRDRWE